MKYPRKSPYLIYKRISEDEYIVKHYFKSVSYKTDLETVTLLRKLNGKNNPYKILPDCSKENVRNRILELKEAKLLEEKKELIKVGIGSCMYPLIHCYPNKMHKQLAKICNILLMIMFIPMFILGICIQSNNESFGYMQGKCDLFIGLLLGLVFGVMIHELAHTCACLSYRGYLFEIGVGTTFFLPMGYVLLEDGHIKNKFKRIQIYAAGIEMNLLLYGVFMFLASIEFINPFIMYLVAVENLVMAIINAMPLGIFDGLKILSTIFGKENLLIEAKNRIKHWNKFKNVHNTRETAITIASCVLVVFQLAIPALLIYEGYSIVQLIFVW